jgi:hypothetical protein
MARGSGGVAMSGPFAVWYFGVIVRGPFARRELARKAMAEVKKRYTCVRPKLRVGKYDKDYDGQIPGWDHPSVLLFAWEARRPCADELAAQDGGAAARLYAETRPYFWDLYT